ncbi:uncharacterized protein LOC104878311 [Vitis vinifera]|uniref:uncharacterized protein LOC104878311 n=1 Tax=Vitis vinifera TaxID=29760 RepID=UPI0005401FEC|nr:uncharacterized protein LOC104878311 [Vitis vinifera]|eukprot:XP_010646761.1 PREDICTED: uncharacterized protein LOC104878311 [Vitis vinifera]
MLKRCIPLLGFVRYPDRESRRKNVGGTSTSLNLSLQSNDFTIRIVHAGGREEVYQNAVLASQLMEKYPGLCVARPEVFKNPHKSLLWPEEKLLPGQKYYLIPCTTAQKLMRRHPEKVNKKQPSEGSKDVSYGNIIVDVDGDNLCESFCSAKDFYTSKERWSSCLLRRSGVKMPSLSPILKEKMHRGLGWEPSLTSIQELSP